MLKPEKGWRAFGVAVQGVSHIKSGTRCQDCVDWTATPDQTLVAAVADGAGSARESERGARLACSAAVSFLREAFSKNAPFSSDSAKPLLEQALLHAREAIYEEASSAGIPAREFGTTLLLLAATENFTAAMQIGDGAIIIRDESGNLSALTTPPASEYLNETIFLTAENALATAQFGIWQGPLSGLAMFSDGLQMLALKMPEGVPHVPFFAPLFQYLERETDLSSAQAKLTAFLTSPKITSRTDDDLTLFFALRPEPS